jgi:hypothetical protein
MKDPLASRVSGYLGKRDDMMEFRRLNSNTRRPYLALGLLAVMRSLELSATTGPPPS